jgi:ribonucleoside-diphosphate reductase beta chain
MREAFTATNWSEPEDDFSVMFYDQQTSQFWLPSEIPIFSDLNQWKSMSDDERLVYSRASSGLNALDTLQGEVGMYELKKYVSGHVPKAVIQFQAAMEDIHAKSYSMMNKTFLTTSEEREVFEWAKTQKHLQYKIGVIKDIFEEEYGRRW